MDTCLIAFHLPTGEGIEPSWNDAQIREALLEPDRLVHESSETLIRVRSLGGEDEVIRFHTPRGATVADMACCAANAWEELHDDMEVRISYLLLQSDGSWLVHWFKHNIYPRNLLDR